MQGAAPTAAKDEDPQAEAKEPTGPFFYTTSGVLEIANGIKAWYNHGVTMV